MKHETIAFKKTTIIYLIAILFLLLALSDLVGLLTGSRSEKGFLGLDLGFTMDGQELDIMGWVGVFVQLYIGYQLFRLSSEGRSCALILLWIWTIGVGITICIVFMLLIMSPSRVTEFSPATFWFFDYMAQIDLGVGLLICFIVLIFYSIPLYFLSRKDIKALFENREKPKEIS